MLRFYLVLHGVIRLPISEQTIKKKEKGKKSRCKNFIFNKNYDEDDDDDDNDAYKSYNNA